MSLKRLKNKIKLLHLGKKEGGPDATGSPVSRFNFRRKRRHDLGASLSGASSKEEDSSVQRRSYSKDFCIILLSVFLEQTTKTNSEPTQCSGRQHSFSLPTSPNPNPNNVAAHIISHHWRGTLLSSPFSGKEGKIHFFIQQPFIEHSLCPKHCQTLEMLIQEDRVLTFNVFWLVKCSRHVITL